MILDKEILRNNLDKLIWEIEEARIKRSEHLIVQLVIVSKYTNTQNIKNLYQLGQRAFGENQIQQLEKRVQELNNLPIAWNYIGRLQTNKINKLIELEPFLFQSLDSLKLANELNKRLEKKDKSIDALLQINSSYEKSKAGVDPKEAIDIYQQIKEQFKRINLKGVMSIGAHTTNKDEIKKSFDTTYKIFEKLKKDGAKICSMGMSNDFKIAIESGSNMIRVGSYLFKKPNN